MGRSATQGGALVSPDTRARVSGGSLGYPETRFRARDLGKSISELSRCYLHRDSEPVYLLSTLANLLRDSLEGPQRILSLSDTSHEGITLSEPTTVATVEGTVEPVKVRATRTFELTSNDDIDASVSTSTGVA